MRTSSGELALACAEGRPIGWNSKRFHPIGNAPAFHEGCAECFAQGSDGLVRDCDLLYRRWAFDVTTIERRVHLWQGMDDRLVAASINKTVADRMPGAVWHPVEGAGPFVAVGSADELFAIAGQELGA